MISRHRLGVLTWKQRAAGTPFSCLLVLMISGCSSSPVPPDDANAGGDERAAARLEQVTRVDHLETLAREPMVVQHPSGTLYVAGYSSQVTGTDWTAPPLLWRSEDGGENWSRVDVGTSESGAQGNSDVDLAIGPDGTIYFVSMGFNRETGSGTHVAIGVSYDNGKQWTWHRLSTTTFDDRPWVSVDPEGTAHVIWNDGEGVSYATSSDSGKGWAEQDRIHPAGGSSHLAVGPKSELAVRISSISASANRFDEDVDLIATSRDQGKTWETHDLPGTVSWDRTFRDPAAVPRWVEPVAWGPSSTLYHLWSEGNIIWLGWSADFGTSWEKSIISEEPGVSFFPFMVSSEAGELAATWFVRTTEQLTARVALIRPGGSGPVVLAAKPFTPDSFRETDSNPIPDPGGEYIPVVFLTGGDLGVASPIQDPQGDRWGFTWWRFRPSTTR